MSNISKFLPEFHEIGNNAKGVEQDVYKSFDNDDGFEDQPETVFDGNEIGRLARSYYTQMYGKDVVMDYDASKFTKAAVKETTASINDDKYKVYYEACFQYKNFTLRPDILIKEEDGSFSIIEVKATSSIKSRYIFDVLYQYTIMLKLGYTINKIAILTLNKDYRLEGEIDLKELFILNDSVLTTAFNIFID
jgi:hypothetical protein